MKFQSIIVALITSTTAGIALADTLTIPNTFVSGETARAAEVNDNFTAVKTEVDDNNARINQNESAMSFKQERVSGSCQAGQYMRVINSDGSVSCQVDINNDTTYTAGSGLTLTGTEFSTDTTAIQSRVSGSCPAGESINVINADGSVGCEVDTDTDTNTTYSAGSGVDLTGTVFSIDSATIQTRVSGSCPAGQYMRVIDSDGSVSCEADTNTTYSEGSGLDLNAGVFSVDPIQTQTRVSQECAAGSSVRVINEDGTVTCEVDDDTTYGVQIGGGLLLDTGEFAIDPTQTQTRVDPSGCAAGSSIRVIDEDGTVTCEVDSNTEYTADAMGFRGITLDGDEFRLSDGYVSVPYSAFVANNVSRTDAEALQAYWGLPTIPVYGGSTTGITTNVPIQITNADHPQLQVCQLAPQMSETGAYTYFVNNGSANCDAIAPLNLPHNAELDSVACKVYDNSVSNSLQVKLYRVPLTGTGSTQDEIFSSNVSATSGAPQQITGSLSDPAATLVENNDYAYHLQMIWEQTALGSNYRIYGCSVGYTF